MNESENRGPVRPGNQKPFDLPVGLMAAVGVHAILFVGLFTVFQWRTEPESFYAELWAPEDASGESVAGKAPETPDTPLPKDTEAAPQPDPREEEAKRLEEERKGRFPELQRATFRVENEKVLNKTLAQLQIRNMTGAVVSRIKHNDEISMPRANTVLHEGDLIRVVGNKNSIEQVKLLIGEQVNGDIPFTKTQELQSLLLTNKNIIGRTLGELNLQGSFGCTVTRVRRSGIDLLAESNLALKFGDKLMVAGEKDNLNELGQFVGNNEKALSDTDFFPIAMGIVLGVLFGKLNISFSDSFSFSPGLTGGILMVALILSAIGKTGPIIWSMSGSANQLLRQLGLLLFLSEVGTSAGSTLVSTFQESGWTMFGIGVIITLVPMIVALVFGYWVFKINILDLLGSIAGGMTSTPGLAAADSMSDSSAPSIAYATVYPIAMVFLILFIQIIAGII